MYLLYLYAKSSRYFKIYSKTLGNSPLKRISRGPIQSNAGLLQGDCPRLCIHELQPFGIHMDGLTARIRSRSLTD